jgi:hypothetical protein
MNVVELLSKLRMIANVEIVVALLPEMVGVSDQSPGDGGDNNRKLGNGFARCANNA